MQVTKETTNKTTSIEFLIRPQQAKRSVLLMQESSTLSLREVGRGGCRQPIIDYGIWILSNYFSHIFSLFVDLMVDKSQKT
jgi:hypothetical protein